MPNTNYTINGVDLDTQLEPIGASTPIANTGFNVNGTDLAQLYASGTTVGYPYGTTNLISGTDIGRQLAGKGSIPKTYGNFQLWGLPVNVSTQKAVPTQSAIRSWTMVSSGNGVSGGIDTTGALYMWGQNFSGSVGTGNSEIVYYPYKVGASSWSAVSTGGAGSTLAIRSDGALFAWGRNVEGQLGLGDSINRFSPVQVGSSSWTMVSVGSATTYAIRSDNTLWAWGQGSSGALGDNTGTVKSSPIQIGSSSWVAVEGRRAGAIAKRSDGIIFGWGLNSNGSIGDGTTVNKSSPVQIGSSSWNIISAAADTSSTGDPVLAIDGNGRLFAWGGNFYGQLGDNTTVNKSSPIQIGSSSWSMVNTGTYLTFGKTTDGTLYAWGNNQWGGAGTGLGNTSSPVAVTNSVGLVSGFPLRFPMSAGNEGASLFLDNNSLLYSCGGNAATSGSGIVLRTAEGGYNVLPTLVPPPSLPTGVGGAGSIATNWNVQVLNSTTSYKMFLTTNTTNNFASYIDSTGKLFSFGTNAFGQLGDGTTTNQNSPVQIGSSSWTMVSLGSSYTAAIRSDGLLFTWGLGNSGRLGDGDTINRSSPVQIGTDSWRTVAAGGGTTYAIRQDGTLWAWGLGTSGALGDGTTDNKSSPIQIGTDVYRAISQAPGPAYAAAIRGDGKLFTWGRNVEGQLGDGTITNRSSPVQIGNDSWTMVACGASRTFAIRSDGALFAWGYNFNGLLGLGDGTTTNKSSPVQIGNSSWVAVAVMGTGLSVGVLQDGNVYAWGGAGTGNLIYVGNGIGYGATVNSPVIISTLSGNQGPQPIPFTANGNLFLSGNFAYNTQAGYVGRTV